MSENTVSIAEKFNNIPAELRRNARFCLWRYETRKGQRTKVPYNSQTGMKARTDQPSTFANFDTAVEVFRSHRRGSFDGIGIRVAAKTNSDGTTVAIGAIDIDHCIDENGRLNDTADAILKLFPDNYFERSPSGHGLRGFFSVDPDYVFDKATFYINNRKLGLEVYFPGATNRFVTVTGNVYQAGSVKRSDASDKAVNTLLDRFMKRPVVKHSSEGTIEPQSFLSDEQVVYKATHVTGSNGELKPSALKFQAFYNGNWEDYYDNQSDADMSFVDMLAFWCGNNAEQIDRIYRSSGMMRPKWDRVQAGTTYGAITIRNAVLCNTSIYSPVDKRDLVDHLNHTDPSSEFSKISDSDRNDGVNNNGKASQAEKSDTATEYKPDLSRITLTIEEMQPNENPRYGRNEIGLGNAFADYFYPIARFNRDRGIWYVFDGKIWRADEGDLMVAELAKYLADQLYSYALRITNEDSRKQYIERVKKLQQRRNRDVMVKDAKSVYPISMDAFDNKSYLFNCLNGTLNLDDGSFYPHDPKDFLTKLSGVTYDPDADCPRWHSFIKEVMMGDKETAEYLQKALGYAMYGASTLECLFILFGATSRNGKGTAMETFLAIMGDYGKTSNPEMLGSKFNSNASGPSEEIARLAGVRFVNISEPEKRMTFNAALVKRMTGNDTLNARFLHENSFDFRPVFKIFINTNYLPNVSDTTLFDSGRLKIIPFNRHFEENEQDKNLKTFFRKEHNLSGIFNWCIEGYRKFKKEGLNPPRSVVEATQSYHEDSDRIGQFVDAYLEEGEAYEARSKAVYLLYRNWCEENNYASENIKNFKDAMGKKFRIVRKRPKDGGENTAVILGVRIRQQAKGSEDPDLVPLQPYPGENAVQK